MGLEELLYGLKSLRKPSVPSSFEDSPLIANLRHDLMKSRSSKKGITAGWNVNKDTRKRNKSSEKIIPLSAYTCHTEKPLLTDRDHVDSSVRSIVDSSTIVLIRSLGYSSLRPIGVDKTLKEIQEDQNAIRKESSRELEPRPRAHQPSSSFVVSAPQRRQEGLTLMQNDAADHSVEESDQSYDYDNDFDVVQVQESLNERTRGTYVEDSQLVDISYVNRYEQSNGDGRQSVNENEESVNELPSLTVSETIEAGAQGSRVSSLTDRLTAAMNEEL